MLDRDQRRLLGEFVRAHRERQRSINSAGRRRTPGLRREELAQQAGISTTWCAWIEQGRAVQASPRALSRLAKALGLSAFLSSFLFFSSFFSFSFLLFFFFFFLLFSSPPFSLLPSLPPSLLLSSLSLPSSPPSPSLSLLPSLSSLSSLLISLFPASPLSLLSHISLPSSLPSFSLSLLLSLSPPPHPPSPSPSPLSLSLYHLHHLFLSSPPSPLSLSLPSSFPSLPPPSLSSLFSSLSFPLPLPTSPLPPSPLPPLSLLFFSHHSPFSLFYLPPPPSSPPPLSPPLPSPLLLAHISLSPPLSPPHPPPASLLFPTSPPTPSVPSFFRSPFPPPILLLLPPPPLPPPSLPVPPHISLLFLPPSPPHSSPPHISHPSPTTSSTTTHSHPSTPSTPHSHTQSSTSNNPITLPPLAERAYLFELAGCLDPELPPEPAGDAPASLLAGVLAIKHPAYGLDRLWNACCWNAAAALLFRGWLDGDNQRNLLRFVFLAPAARKLIPGWENRARRLLAEFRADYSHNFRDSRVRTLVETLRRDSPLFTKAWDEQGVRYRSGGVRHFSHPDDGPLRFEQHTFSPSERPDHKLVMLVPIARVA